MTEGSCCGSVALKNRVAALEIEVVRLRELVEKHTKVSLPCWKNIVGTFAGDPRFKEAVQLGREYRQSLRPDRKKRRKH
jgi:hypothetical protein